MSPAPELILVDGLNVLGSRPDGWWRDRPAAMRRLVEEVIRRREPGDPPVEVIFDGNEHPLVAGAAAGDVGVGFAPGGPDAADKVIAARVRGSGNPGAILVATSDRRLRSSVKAAGGMSISAGEFIARYLAREPGEGDAS